MKNFKIVVTINGKNFQEAATYNESQINNEVEELKSTYIMAGWNFDEIKGVEISSKEADSMNDDWNNKVMRTYRTNKLSQQAR